MAKRTAVAFLAFVLIASVFCAGAFAMSSDVLETGARVEVRPGESRFTFLPKADAPYVFCFFSEGEASAELWKDDQAVAAGSGTGGLFSADLTGDTEYTFRISADDWGTVEIMRDTLGRSFSQPIELTGNDLKKEKLMVSHEDVHFYAFVAPESGAATVQATALPDAGDLLLDAYFTDEKGTVLQRAQSGADGELTLYVFLQEGERYILRLSAQGETAGAYRVSVEPTPVSGGVAGLSSFVVRPDFLNMRVGQESKIRAGAPAETPLSWASWDTAVCTVDQTGLVTAVGAGSTVVTATAPGGVQESCVIDVESIPLYGIGFMKESIVLREGETIYPDMDFYPSNASNRRITYNVSDPSVAYVRADGLIEAVGEGTAFITAISEEGGYTDRVELVVTEAPPKYRALLVGQQMYEPGVNSVRVGSINTTQSMANLLSTQTIDGRPYETNVLLDASREEVFAAIEATFADACENDVSLFYITCHGYYRAGMSFLECCDGSLITAIDLERALRKVPGTVVVIADCCSSGGLIGERASMANFNRAIASAFGVNDTSAPFKNGKYKVLLSATLDQESYRLSFSNSASENDMATVFGRSLCDGAGWSIDRGERAAFRADINYDKLITLNEISLYASRRVMWYLGLATAGTEGPPVVQTVTVYPKGDSFVLFGRTG